MPEKMVADINIRAKAGSFPLDLQFKTNAKITALFGPSGAGKTSTLRLIAGLNTPTSGTISIGGTCYFDTESKINLAVKNRQCGYVFQEAALFPHLTVKRNLTYGIWAAGKTTRFSTDEVTELLAIQHLLGRYPASLSGGEKQRVAIGRALLSAPEILLLDEPFSGLDLSRKLEIYKFLEAVGETFGLPVIFVSHSIPEIVRLAENIVFLKEGKVSHSGPVETVLTASEFDETGLLVGNVSAKNTVDGFDVIEVEGQNLFLTARGLSPNKKVRMTIAPSEVILASELPAKISAQNRLEVEITDIRKLAGPVYQVRLSVGAQQICAHVTKKAKQDMGLEVGMRCYALLKTIALSNRSYF